MPKIYKVGDVINDYCLIENLGKITDAPNARNKWVCQCINCGRKQQIATNKFKTHKCDCVRFVGKTRGYLTIHSYSEVYDKWICSCGNCGNDDVLVSGSYLKNNYKSANCGCLSRLTGDDPHVVLFRNYKRRIVAVHNRKYKHTGKVISFYEYEKIVLQGCDYCGRHPNQPQYVNGGDVIYTHGVDRVDSSIGYVSGNCVPSCFVCNRMKSDMDAVEFALWIRDVYDWLSGHHPSDDSQRIRHKMYEAINEGRKYP